MSKVQRGNKESKKPKKVHEAVKGAPPAIAVPAASAAIGAGKQRKK